MSQWTEGAKAELERYLELARQALPEASGVDPSEVIGDLRRHVEESISEAGLAVVRAEDVKRVVEKLGVPETPQPLPFPATASAPLAGGATQRKPGYWILILGVLLPTVTLAIESTTWICAGAFFHPLRTFWHILLVGLVPASNLLGWLAVRRGRFEHRSILGWLNGLAIGVSLFYTVIFMPMCLPGLIGVVFYGFGLLPLSPLLALIATLGLHRHLSRPCGESASALRGVCLGMAAGFLILVGFELPVALTRWGLHLASSDSETDERRGLRLLRGVGHERTMLRACYGQTPAVGIMDLVGYVATGGERIPTETARTIYYRVTGCPFNSVPAPVVRTPRGPFQELDDWTWDPDQGGQAVGARITGLNLASSRIDVVIEADAAVAYLEWTLEFQNDAPRAREARAQVLLPPGGVVSRLTLWVNGVEREAAFAGRGHARQAYEQIAIRQRRDPVLVTTSGPDRVLVQCFPVPAGGGLMKVRLGITAPLVIDDTRQGRLRWPQFIERNFTIREQVRHALWAEYLCPCRVRGRKPRPRGIERRRDRPSSSARGRLEPGLGGASEIVLEPGRDLRSGAGARIHSAAQR